MWLLAESHKGHPQQGGEQPAEHWLLVQSSCLELSKQQEVGRGNLDSLRALGFLHGGQFTSTVGCLVGCARELLALSFPTVTYSYLDARGCLYGLRASNHAPVFGRYIHGAEHLNG